MALSPSFCWHGLPALQQHLVGSYREDTCAGWELLEYMVNAVAFVLSGVWWRSCDRRIPAVAMS